LPQPLQPGPLEPSPKTIGLPFIELQSVDSTNNYARQQIHADLAVHGMSVFAHNQTEGKGQMGRKWVSEKEANIALSVIIQPSFLTPMQQFHLSACAAVSAHELVSKYAGNDTKIKWPNDLYWQDRKAGGVLIESVISSKLSPVSNPESRGWLWAIIGIGINVNQTIFPDWLPNPVSLKQITGKSFDTVLLAKEFCGMLNKNFIILRNGGFEKIYALYLASLYKKDSAVKFKKGSRIFEATIKTVSQSGKLIVKHGIEEVLDFAEVEWLLK
jgi:BirA family biotin operon repressor/biotin-[acetyl-CoA-carboxylase] ligase